MVVDISVARTCKQPEGREALYCREHEIMDNFKQKNSIIRFVFQLDVAVRIPNVGDDVEHLEQS